MQTAREKITEIVLAQPADTTYDEIVRELAFAKMIERGLDDARAGLLVSNEDMARRIGNIPKSPVVKGVPRAWP